MSKIKYSWAPYWNIEWVNRMGCLLLPPKAVTSMDIRGAALFWNEWRHYNGGEQNKTISLTKISKFFLSETDSRADIIPKKISVGHGKFKERMRCAGAQYYQLLFSDRFLKHHAVRKLVVPKKFKRLPLIRIEAVEAIIQLLSFLMGNCWGLCWLP